MNSLALVADGRHLLTDVVTSVGVVIGLGLVWLTGFAMLDPIVALIVALHILVTGWRLARQAIGGLMDEADPGSARRDDRSAGSAPRAVVDRRAQPALVAVRRRGARRSPPGRAALLRRGPAPRDRRARRARAAQRDGATRRRDHALRSVPPPSLSGLCDGTVPGARGSVRRAAAAHARPGDAQRRDARQRAHRSSA